MKNLPVFGQDLLKGCKVFAVVGALSLCCACGGSEPSGTPEGDVSASPMSGEVEVKGDEVASTSGEATSEEAKSGEVAEAAGNEATAEPAAEEVANNDKVAAKPEPAKTPEKKVAAAKVRDPFDKYFGAPAIGTSLSGGVRPSSDRGKIGVNSAQRKRLAQRKLEKNGPAPVVKVSKPDVKVTGILRSGSTYKAILQGPEKAIMVSSGEQIGGYRIAAVTNNDVTLVYKNKYKFVIPLEKEVFGSTGAPVSAGDKMTSNPVVAAPVIEVTK